ncbi:MAG TPA: sigma-70 family RNA polymerase sigma factor [Vicinamibacterales bacterium]
MNNPRSDTLTIRQGTTSQVTPGVTGSSSRQATTGGHDAASAGELVKDEKLFLANLPVINAVIGQVCHRQRLTAAEADDFASEVHLHFIERNYEPLRRFEGRSTLRTYLIVVIQRLCLDYRNRTWGRWRPSIEAKRQGSIAILVERLIVRDGRSFEEVVETLRTNHGLEMGAALQALCVKLAKRAPARQFVPEVEADDIPSPMPQPEDNVLRGEQEFLAKRVQAALDRVRQTLPPEDGLILKMRFEDAVPVADIARALHLNQKRLYRSIEILLAMLRTRLEAEGISREEVSTLFAGGGQIETDIHEVEYRAGGAGTSHPAERARGSWQKS